MKFKVNRNQVIKALQVEKLTPGAFFDAKNDSAAAKADIANCKVCAVGSVIRTCMSKKELAKFDTDTLCMIGEEVTQNDYIINEDDYEQGLQYRVHKALGEENYLGALSIKFEAMMKDRKLITPFVRNELIRFVKGNFPTSFTVHYDN